MFKNKTHNAIVLSVLLTVIVVPGWKAGNSPFESAKRTQGYVLNEFRKSTVFNRTSGQQESKTFYGQQTVVGYDRPILYLTGIQKKQNESSLYRLLNWDFKLKVKLNRNLNIIFSYN